MRNDINCGFGELPKNAAVYVTSATYNSIAHVSTKIVLLLGG